MKNSIPAASGSAIPGARLAVYAAPSLLSAGDSNLGGKLVGQYTSLQRGNPKDVQKSPFWNSPEGWFNSSR